MKIIKIILFCIILLNFYRVLAINSIPIGYWGTNSNKNIEGNIIYNLPVGYFGNNVIQKGIISDTTNNNTLYNSKIGFIGTNFNKTLTYTGVLYQTPIGFFATYKGKKVVFPKLIKINNVLTNTGNIIINNTGETITNNTGETITNNNINNTGSIVIDNTEFNNINTGSLDVIINDNNTGSINTINNDIKNNNIINNTGSINILNDNNISNNKNNIILNNTGSINTGSIIIKKSKEQIKQEELNKLRERIQIAQANKNIYTYRNREYIKNSDGTFTNVDTLNLYTGNVDHLKKKIYITPKVENISSNIIQSNNINTQDNTNSTQNNNENSNNTQQNNIIDNNTNNNQQNNTNTQDNTNSTQNNNSNNISNNNENYSNSQNNNINSNNNSNLYNSNTLNTKVSDEVKRQIKENEINKLRERINIARYNKDLYTYRRRDYIKNSDGTFINIDTLNPYTGNINHLKKKVYYDYKNNNISDNNTSDNNISYNSNNDSKNINSDNNLKNNYKINNKSKNINLSYKNNYNNISNNNLDKQNNKGENLLGNLTENERNIKLNVNKEFNLKTKKVVENMLYAFYVNKYLSKEKMINFENYTMLKSCFLGDKCENKSSYLTQKNKILSNLNIEKESRNLGIILNSSKILDYKKMLNITFKIFGRDKFYKSKITKSTYSYYINKLISKILKIPEKSYTNISFLSYERIYFSLLESKDFDKRLSKIIFRN